MKSMRGAFFVFVSILVVSVIMTPRFAAAAELVMFESPTCEWCELWEKEVGIVYSKTEEARIAPLRRIAISESLSRDLSGFKPVVYTPTFILVENGREVGRITGYPGESHFWALLEELIGKLGTVIRGCRHPDKLSVDRIEGKGDMSC